MRDLNIILKQCEDELDSLGIHYGNVVSIKSNNRFKSKWGICKMKTGGNYVIEISNTLLNYGSEKGIKQTVMHELLHTCCYLDGHKDKWKMYANRVNCELGYNIKRTNSAKELGIDREVIEKNNYKYILKCASCGNSIGFARKGKVVKYPQYYRCGCCRGLLTRIK